MAVSTTAMAGPGNRRITPIGAVASRPSDPARTGLSGPSYEPRAKTAARASTAAMATGPVGRR